MNSTPLPVFVYGTLRNGLGNYNNILAGNTSREADATLAGARMLDAGGCPFVELTSEGTVIGEVMYLSATTEAETMVRLDRLEGFKGAGDRSNMYERVQVQVLLADASTVLAWVYVTAPGSESFTRSMPVIASGDWRNRRAVATMW